jgi:KDO2-lipid IV(A) lauroyltransferase
MPRRSRLKTSKNWLIFQGLRTVSSAGRAVSLRRARSIGAAIGELAFRTVHRERRKAVRSLATAFPEKSDAERRDIAHRTFRHLGTSLGEISWMPNLDRRVLDETTIIEGLEHFHTAVNEKRGVVLFTGHCGNWEWMAAAIGILGFDMNVIAREIYDPRINRFIVEARERHNIKTIGRGSMAAARDILQTLRSGAVLGVLIDQNIKAEAADVDFFGKPAGTPIGPAKLAIRAGAMAITGFIERQGEKHLLRFQPPLATSRDDDPVALTQLMTRAIEQQIRRVPEQWVWMHDRWKIRKQ